MARADLHVHSVYSEHPSDWFLQKLGARESYTDPETIYRLARERGMDFVTITDHNRIDGILSLCRNHPLDTFTGVEFTTYFPEDGCKVHVLVYGLTAEQFEELNVLRQDIFKFSDRIRELGLPHSVAHATYSVNGILGIRHLERLLLLFDVFEGINGGRNAAGNNAWRTVLSGLSEKWIEELERRHGLEAAGTNRWFKGQTGGSDDHAGLYVGRTFTVAEASSPAEFLEAIRCRRTAPGGRSNDYKSLVFSVYRIACDYARQKRGESRGFLSALSDLVFERKNLRIRDKLFLKKQSATKGGKARIYSLLNGLIDDLNSREEIGIDGRLDLVYKSLTDLSDEFLGILVNSFKRDIAEGDLAGFASSVSAAFPGVFLYLPFFTAIREMFSNRGLLESMRVELPSEPGAPSRRKRILWFTDTFSDLNGVSVTLGRIASLAGRPGGEGPDILFVVSLDGQIPEGVPADRVIDLPAVASFELPGYDRYTLKVPSVLRSLDRVAALEPDEIYVSTHGPVGLVGILIAKLMSLRCTGFFHTDYSMQASRIMSDKTVTALIEEYTKWFYGCCDEVRVPTDRYISLLTARGYQLRKVSRFDRGIDTRVFAPVMEPRSSLAGRFGVTNGPVLLYTGRISREKNLDLVLSAYRMIVGRFPDANLLLAGDGPYLPDLEAAAKGLDRVRFLGRMKNETLPALYTFADLLVFPSETDTFGMTVLEAQTCGLPCLVSRTGGPAEIIDDAVTGFVIPDSEPTSWAEAVVRVLDMKRLNYPEYSEMRHRARLRVLEKYDWDKNYIAMFDTRVQTGSASRAKDASSRPMEEALLAGAGR